MPPHLAGVLALARVLRRVTVAGSAVAGVLAAALQAEEQGAGRGHILACAACGGSMCNVQWQMRQLLLAFRAAATSWLICCESATAPQWSGWPALPAPRRARPPTCRAPCAAPARPGGCLGGHGGGLLLLHRLLGGPRRLLQQLGEGNGGSRRGQLSMAQLGRSTRAAASGAGGGAQPPAAERSARGPASNLRNRWRPAGCPERGGHPATT